ncbi:MAG TPA: tol-pal system-associated acyl-CoA thioesterase [Aestuariivirga sp.]|jgi:acyl-CoA thioester hydrolase|nr:tol-pal system-associated acyl-CoA thioesterase [Aestuariivirga sp.]
MTERWPDISGRIEGKVHILPVRVYYEDTDFSGAVYHANYLKFCERARSDCLRLLGIHHSEMHGTASFVVRRMVCDFLKPALIDNLLEVETRFVEFAGARMELTQTVMRASEKLFEAQVTVALVDGQGRPKRLPPDMTKTFLSRVESAT